MFSKNYKFLPIWNCQLFGILTNFGSLSEPNYFLQFASGTPDTLYTESEKSLNDNTASIFLEYTPSRFSRLCKILQSYRISNCYGGYTCDCTDLRLCLFEILDPWRTSEKKDIKNHDNYHYHVYGFPYTKGKFTILWTVDSNAVQLTESIKASVIWPNIFLEGSTYIN